MKIVLCLLLVCILISANAKSTFRPQSTHDDIIQEMLTAIRHVEGGLKLPSYQETTPAMKKNAMTFGEYLEFKFSSFPGKHPVTPVVGSIVRCRLGFGELDYWDHSGVYVGHSRIIHRDGEGIIQEVSPAEFLMRMDGQNRAKIIFVVCDTKGRPIGKPEYADRARRLLNSQIKGYDLLYQNCHHFCQQCIGNECENMDSSPLKASFSYLCWELTKQNCCEHYGSQSLYSPTQMLVWYSTDPLVQQWITKFKK